VLKQKKGKEDVDHETIQTGQLGGKIRGGWKKVGEEYLFGGKRGSRKGQNRERGGKGPKEKIS